MRELNFGDFTFLLIGLQWTVLLSIVSFGMGAMLAAIFVLLNLLRNAVINTVIAGYVGLFQGTPIIGQLLFFYFGLTLIGMQLSAFVSATLALSLFAAAFLFEIWRGAIAAIPRQQWEAAESLGLSRIESLKDVILPQAIRGATPPTIGFVVQLIKDTSLVSVIGFVELTRAGQEVSNATFESFIVFGFIAALYFCLCFPLTLLSREIERKVA